MTTVDTSANVSIVEARREHIPFVAWVILTAARSHLERSTWDFYVDKPEADVLRYLEALADTETRHFAHYSNFLVAEVDGAPAAALSGYFEAERGMPTLLQGMAEANAATGLVDDPDAGMQRAGTITLVSMEHAEGAWIVEWVATHPEFRRRGLVDRLIEEILDVGRGRGASTAEIGVLIGNDGAQRAYEKAGFAFVDEKRHPAFEAVYQCPGTRHFRRSI